MDLKLGKSAYIKLVKGSLQQEITLDEVKEILNTYIKKAESQGEQAGWDYEDSAFPYTIEEKEEGNTKYLYLKGRIDGYNFLIMGVGKEEVDGESQSYIQVVLPDEEYRTHGDQGKGNEFTKYFGRHLKAKTHLFNGRVMYFNPRK